MKLSDTQYKLLTRVGLLLAVAATLCYDKVSIAYRPAFIALAIASGVVGFFPLVTSHVFDSPEDSESEIDQRTVSHPFHFIEAVPIEATPIEGSGVSDRSLNHYLEHLYATLRSEFKGQESYILIHEQLNALAASQAVLAMAFKERRTRRVKEMCEVISKLGAIPQEFTVELTSEDSIIVHCQPRQAVYNTDPVSSERWVSVSAEKWLRKREAKTMGTVH